MKRGKAYTVERCKQFFTNDLFYKNFAKNIFTMYLYTEYSVCNFNLFIL